MKYVDTESGEILDTSTVFEEMKERINYIDNLYRQLKFHGVIVDNLHQRAFYNGVEMLNYMIYDIKDRIEISSGKMTEKKRRPLSEFSQQLKL